MRISTAFAIAIAFISLGGTVRAQSESLGGESPRTARMAQAENGLPEYVPSPRPVSEVLSGRTYLVPDWLQGVTVEPANLGHDGEEWLNRFGDQIHSEVSPPSQVLVDPAPVGFRPWWERPVREPIAPALPVSIDQLIEGALQYSSYVRVVSSEPMIRRTVIVEEQAAFDWRGFLESTYNDSNNPVGNILTTGTNEDRFKDRTWSSQGGVRRTTAWAGISNCPSASGGSRTTLGSCCQIRRRPRSSSCVTRSRCSMEPDGRTTKAVSSWPESLQIRLPTS